MSEKKLNLLVESFSKRLSRAESILLVIGRKEKDIDLLGATMERMKALLRIPVGAIFSTGLPPKGGHEYSEMLESYDFAIGIGVKNSEIGAAVLLMDFRDAGAYTVLIDRDESPLKRGVNIQIKSKLPGLFNFMLKRAGEVKNAKKLE